MLTENDLARFFRKSREESQKTRYITLHSCKDERRILAREIEAEAASRLQALGFQVRSQAHKAHFDLAAIDGDRGAMLRVEVKASRWDGARYQFNLRDNDADVVLFGCMDGALGTTALSWFVVPFDKVRGKTVVKVTEHDPADYMGKLTMFFEAWDILPDLAKSARNPYQPELWEDA